MDASAVFPGALLRWRRKLSVCLQLEMCKSCRIVLADRRSEARAARRTRLTAQRSYCSKGDSASVSRAVTCYLSFALEGEAEEDGGDARVPVEEEAGEAEEAGAAAEGTSPADEEEP